MKTKDEISIWIKEKHITESSFMDYGVIGLIVDLIYDYQCEMKANVVSGDSKSELEKLIDKWEIEKGSFIPNAPIYQEFINEAKEALERELFKKEK